MLKIRIKPPVSQIVRLALLSAFTLVAFWYPVFQLKEYAEYDDGRSTSAIIFVICNFLVIALVFSLFALKSLVSNVKSVQRKKRLLLIFFGLFAASPTIIGVVFAAFFFGHFFLMEWFFFFA